MARRLSLEAPPPRRGESRVDPRPFEWRRLLPERTGFRGVLPGRWVVERTFWWFGHSRRLSKDDERLCETGEALIYAAMPRLLARRLARNGPFQIVSETRSATNTGIWRLVRCWYSAYGGYARTAASQSRAHSPGSVTS